MDCLELVSSSCCNFYMDFATGFSGHAEKVLRVWLAVAAYLWTRTLSGAVWFGARTKAWSPVPVAPGSWMSLTWLEPCCSPYRRWVTLCVGLLWNSGNLSVILLGHKEIGNNKKNDDNNDKWMKITFLMCLFPVWSTYMRLKVQYMLSWKQQQQQQHYQQTS